MNKVWVFYQSAKLMTSKEPSASTNPRLRSNSRYISYTYLIDVKMKLRIITKNMQSIQRLSFPQNRFYGLWSSQRPPVREVNFQTALKEFKINVKMKLLWKLLKKVQFRGHLRSAEVKNSEKIKKSFVLQKN